MTSIEQFETGGSHREVGLAIGRRFAHRIHHLLDNYELLQEHLLPFYRSPDGRRLYRSFLDLHRAQVPGYVVELEGIAQGAERPFEEIFLVNLRAEYRTLIELGPRTSKAPASEGKGCTDCLVLTSDAAIIGHNEDGTPAALGQMLLVRAQIGDNPAFTALCYPGFLPGNALGFNEVGLVHSIDSVLPRQARVGLGRHFIARSLFDARTLDEAIKRATVPGRASGFTYNMGSLPERRVVSLEVAPDWHHTHEVQGHYLHTNHYLCRDDIDQESSPSSRRRLARAQALSAATPPTSAAHVLTLLGDEADGEYPIYRQAILPDASATLCTALFDLEARQLCIYSGHPVREPERCVTLAL